MMNYAQLNPDGTFMRQIKTTGNVEWDATHFCPPGALTTEEAAYFRVVPFDDIPKPEHDRITHAAVRDGGEFVAGQWQTKWRIDALPPEIAAANRAQAESSRVASLWQAAHDMEFNAISGSAIGLITLGVLQAKPKCLAAQGWIKSIWTEYYIRKESGSADTDFSMSGKCPHSVPELMAELGL